ncbi:MAG: hypothetical protein NVS3B17_11140 [Vulcanimicrobiaceae bacterium]
MSHAIAVGFDFDHTLGLDNKLERTVALEMLADLARDAGATYEVARAEAAIDDVLVTYRAATVTVEAAIAGFFERFAPVGAVAIDRASDFRDVVVARAPDFVRARPQTEAMLAALDAMGVRYALLTNGWSPLQEEKARLIGFRGSVFVSERIGARKPSREAFDVLAKHLDVSVASLWYVGDDVEADVVGPAALGVTTVWLAEDGATYPAGQTKPAHTIRTLDELPALLQGPVSKVANSAG